MNVGGGSDSSRGGSSSCLKNKKEPVDFEPWKPSPTGSPDPTSGINGSAVLPGATAAEHAQNADSKKTVLLKSTLSSNIGELKKIYTPFYHKNQIISTTTAKSKILLNKD